MTTTIEREKLGAPGIPHEIILVPGPSVNDPSTDDYDRALMHDEAERNFRVIAHLGKEPGSFAEPNIDLSLDTTKGASLLIAPSAAKIRIQTPSGEVTGHLNAKKELSALEFTCRARTNREAFAKYSAVVAPLLDHFSFHQNVPLFVRAITLLDEKNHVLRATYNSPFPYVSAIGEGNFDLELWPFYALYREALASGSIYYQFLCYAKILEGIFRWLLRRLREEAATRGLPRPIVAAVVEDDSNLEGESRKWIGENVDRVFTDHLEPKFRDAIAHFTLEGGGPLIVSDYTAGADFAGNLYLARLCARGLLKAVEVKIRDMKTALGVSALW